MMKNAADSTVMTSPRPTPRRSFWNNLSQKLRETHQIQFCDNPSQNWPQAKTGHTLRQN